MMNTTPLPPPSRSSPPPPPPGRGFDTVLAMRRRHGGAGVAMLLALVGGVAMVSTGCGGKQTRVMEVTAYCGCGTCCGWERGSWTYLKLNQWNRYVNTGSRKGQPYTGRTASGTKPRQYDPGLFSTHSLTHPWMIPVRIVFFPWMLTSKKGTIAADTNHYPFGTVLYVPGYGWGVVEDRGGAIKGPDKLDVYFRSHSRALRWGRQRVSVEIEK